MKGYLKVFATLLILLGIMFLITMLISPFFPNADYQKIGQALGGLALAILFVMATNKKKDSKGARKKRMILILALCALFLLGIIISLVRSNRLEKNAGSSLKEPPLLKTTKISSRENGIIIPPWRMYNEDGSLSLTNSTTQELANFFIHYSKKGFSKSGEFEYETLNGYTVLEKRPDGLPLWSYHPDPEKLTIIGYKDIPEVLAVAIPEYMRRHKIPELNKENIERLHNLKPLEKKEMLDDLKTRRAEFHGLCPWVNV